MQLLLSILDVSPSHVSTAHPSYALVRSESAPLNVWDDSFASNLADLPADDSFPPHRVTFAPVSSSRYDHFSSSPTDSAQPSSGLESTDLHSTSNQTNPRQRRPPHPRTSSKPIPPRSASSIELAGIFNSGVESGISAVPAVSSSNTAARASSGNLKKTNVQSWHKSVFDMIQDDFPRTPSPMFSSLLPWRSTTTVNSESDAPRPRPSPADRRSRLASCASLDLDIDRLGTAADPASDLASTARLDDDVDHAKPPLRHHHRRSASVNWTGDLTAIPPPELSPSSSKRKAVPSAAAPSTFFPNKAADVPSGPNPPANPGPGSTVEPPKTPSPPRPHTTVQTAGRVHIPPPRSSSPLNRLGHHTSVPSVTTHPAPHMPTYNTPSHTAEPAVSNGIDDLVNPGLLNPDYDYLYDQSEGGIPSTAANVQTAPFPSQPFVGSQPHIGSSPGVMNTHPQQMANGSYANVFPGMGLFPSPFSNNSVGVTNGGVAPVYNESFRDGMAAADNLKNISLQMAAFISAQQQFYAAQVAQMAAIAGTSAFSSPASLTGNIPTTALGHPSASPPGMNLRSPWDGRDTNGGHRSMPRPRHQFENYRNGFGHVNNGKKVSSVDMGNKGRNSRGRRAQRGHEEIAVMSSHKVVDRSGLVGSSLGNGMQESSHMRSPLLEDFRATSLSIGRGIGSVGDMGIGGAFGGNSSSAMPNAREWQLSEITNHVVEFATDQHGSRFIQQKLESASEEDKEAVLGQALTDAQRLMTDVFGNYVVQKLLDHGGNKAISAIAQELEGRMLSLSLHMYGCRVVQKALEVLESSYRAALVKELDGHVLKCIRDQNGNHVIQKCVELVESDSVQFIVNAVHGQSVSLAGHSYGCRVVQRILEHGAEKQKAPIMIEIMSAIADLIKDQYGNYVIQHVVEHGTEEERGVIMNLVRGEVCQLSQHKFASNVVERCLQFGSLEERQVLIELLIVGEGNAHGSPLNQLVRDQFGIKGPGSKN